VKAGCHKFGRDFVSQESERHYPFREEAIMRASALGSVDPDVVVVGGGLAGLSAAALVAQAGRSVVVFERAGEVGGRAATQVRHGISFNLGPHALYFSGHAFKLLRELDVPFTGRLPSPGKSRLLTQDGDTPLPRGPVSLLGSRLFGLREKACLIRFLATLGELDGHAFDCIPLSEWVRNGFGEGNAARFLLALFRVSTYADDAERLSAWVAIEQLKLALKGNVWYIDGGWQTLVDGLRCRATDAGATVLTGTRVMSVCDSDDGVIVGLAGGEVVRSRAAVVAVPPKAATELLGLTPDAPLAAWTASSIPIKAACLDVALDRLERPQQRFALGLDRPYYCSVHSAAVKLAPEGTSVLHVMKYLREGTDSNAESIEKELEGCIDRLQPGWRAHTVARRYLPGMTVSYSLPLARENGLSGRPAVSVTGHPSIFLAGDWVGPEGLLADASAASARSAVRQVLSILDRTGAESRRERVHATS
jgi:phytoene dehydrogenase-like protein